MGLLLFTLLFTHSEVSQAQEKATTAQRTKGDISLSVASKLISIRPFSSDESLKVHFVFDGKPPFHKSFHLINPPRLALDFENVQPALDKENLSLTHTLVKNIRVGRHPGKIRVVFDLVALDAVSYKLMEGDDRIVVSFRPIATSFRQVIETPSEDPKRLPQSVLFEADSASIKSIDFYTADSGKSLLVITSNIQVQPEVQSTSVKSIALILPKTELPSSLEKPISTRPEETGVVSIVPSFNSQSQAVEFHIELAEQIPYSMRLAETEIRLEFGPVKKTFAAVEQLEVEKERMATEETYPKPAAPGADLPEEIGQEEAAAIDEELLAELYGIEAEEKTEAEEREPLEEEEILAYSPMHSKFDDFIDELAEGFSVEFRIYGIETSNKVSGSRANPQNILEIPRYTLELELRPDFYLNYRRLRLSFRPRNTFIWQKWEDGLKSGEDDEDIDLFVNYWLAGLQMTDSLWISYGRENIQWGPSYLVSPSNPFFANNGLANPKREVPGQDFGRALWAPTSSFSASFIANTGECEAEFLEDFERVYALKLDLTGHKKYFSLIGSSREHDRERLGAYAGWTVTGGLLVYFEGQISQGTSALYPVETDQTTPTGDPIITLEETEDDSDSLEYELIVGQSYTFEAGPTITLEYFYNSPGYNDKQAEEILDFADQVNEVLVLPPVLQQQVDLNFEQTTDLRLRRLRKNYLLLQYQHANIRDILNIALRYTYNLDDSGSQLNPIIQYDLNDNTQLFLVGVQNFGDKEDEFRFFVDYSYFIGFQYTF